MNLYVSNISDSATESALKELFSGIGEVTSAKIINDKITGQSRGFGFVEMPNDAEAEEAIEKLTNTSFLSRVLVVAQSKPKPQNRSAETRQQS